MVYKKQTGQYAMVYGYDSNAYPAPTGIDVGIVGFLSRDGAIGSGITGTFSYVSQCSGWFKTSLSAWEVDCDVMVLQPRYNGYIWNDFYAQTAPGTNLGLNVENNIKQAILYNSGLLTLLSGTITTINTGVSNNTIALAYSSGLLVSLSGYISGSAQGNNLETIKNLDIFISGTLVSMSGTIATTLSTLATTANLNIVKEFNVYNSGLLTSLSGVLAKDTNVSRVRDYSEFASGILTHLSGIMLSTASLVYTNSNIEYVSGVVKLLPNVDTIMASGNEEGWNAGAADMQYLTSNMEYVSGVVKELPNITTIVASGNAATWNAAGGSTDLSPATIGIAYLSGLLVNISGFVATEANVNTVRSLSAYSSGILNQVPSLSTITSILGNIHGSGLWADDLLVNLSGTIQTGISNNTITLSYVSGLLMNLSGFISAGATSIDQTNIKTAIAYCSGLMVNISGFVATNVNLETVKNLGIFNSGTLVSMSGSVSTTLATLATTTNLNLIKEFGIYNSGLLSHLSGILATENNVNRVRDYSEYGSGILTHLSGIIYNPIEDEVEPGLTYQIATKDIYAVVNGDANVISSGVYSGIFYNNLGGTTQVVHYITDSGRLVS